MRVYEVQVIQAEPGKESYPYNNETFHIRSTNPRRAAAKAVRLARKRFTFRSKPIIVKCVQEIVSNLHE